MKHTFKFILLLLVLAAGKESFSQHYQNYAFTFNGTNSYVAVASDAELNTPNGISMECWIKITSYPASNPMIICAKNYITSWAFGINAAGSLFFQKVNTVLSTTPVPLNVWTHVAATYDGVNQTNLYIDGVNAGSSSSIITGTIPVNTDSLYIGCDRNGSSPAYFFTGTMDNMRFWNYARTALQISQNRFQLYQLFPATGAYTGLIASYAFDNESGDWSGNSFNTGYMRNIGTYNGAGKPSNYEDYTNSLYLDQISYVALSNISDLNASTGITVESWIRRDTTLAQNTYQNIVNYSDPAGYAYALYLTGGGTNLAFTINNDAIVAVSSGVTIGGRWTHVAATYDAVTGRIKLYVNGDSVGTITGTPQNISTNANDSLFLGYTQASCCTGNRFYGQMQGIRVYKNYVKTSTLIKHEMYQFRSQTTGVQPDVVIDFMKYTNWPRINSGGSSNILRFRGNAKLVSSHQQNNAFPTPPVLFENSYLNDNAFVFSTKRFYVPDNNVNGVTDSVFVPAGGSLQNLKVAVMLNTTYVSDLRIKLINPLGTSVMLTPSSGGQSGNDMICVFDMTADSTIAYSTTSVQPPFTPRLKPANNFSTLYGQNAGGWWKMNFSDVVAGDIAYVSGWAIEPSYPTGINGNTQNPVSYELAQNYPNPFNPSTSIKYSIAQDNITKLVVYDITGREVSTLINGFKKAGNYEITFDASKLSSGVYFYKLESGSYTETKKMMLIK